MIRRRAIPKAMLCLWPSGIQSCSRSKAAPQSSFRSSGRVRPGLTLSRLVAHTGMEMPIVCAFRMAAARQSVTWLLSVASNFSGWGNLLGADQKLAPLEVTASSGNVCTS